MDNPRWCRWCADYTDHHTDRHPPIRYGRSTETPIDWKRLRDLLASVRNAAK